MRRRSVGRGQPALLVVFLVFVSLGTFTWPSGVLSYSGYNSDDGLFLLLYAAAWGYVACGLLPPILVLAAAAIPQLATAEPYYRMVGGLFQIFTVVAFIGLLASVGFSLLAGSSAALAVNMARALVLFLQMPICWELLDSLAVGDRALKGKFLAICAVPVLAISLWSIASASAAAFQASVIARGGPYCIGDTMHSGYPYGEIDSIADLRGVDLVTHSEEYNPDSYWYFHAVLIAPENNQSVYWNWSVRQMAFTPISEKTLRLLDHRIDRACDPKMNFVSWLLWPF